MHGNLSGLPVPKGSQWVLEWRELTKMIEQERLQCCGPDCTVEQYVWMGARATIQWPQATEMVYWGEQKEWFGRGCKGLRKVLSSNGYVQQRQREWREGGAWMGERESVVLQLVFPWLLIMLHRPPPLEESVQGWNCWVRDQEVHVEGCIMGVTIVNVTM